MTATYPVVVTRSRVVDPATWARVLGRLMTDAGMTNKALFGRQVKVDRRTVSRWLAGQVSPTWQNVRDAATVLGADPDAVLREVGYDAGEPEPDIAAERDAAVPPGFGAWLRLMRITSGYPTTYALARAVDREQELVEAWETEQVQPQPLDIKRLAEVLTDVPRPMLLRASGYIHRDRDMEATQEWLDDPNVDESRKAAVREVMRMFREDRQTG